MSPLESLASSAVRTAHKKDLHTAQCDDAHCAIIRAVSGFVQMWVPERAFAAHFLPHNSAAIHCCFSLSILLGGESKHGQIGTLIIWEGALEEGFGEEGGGLQPNIFSCLQEKKDLLPPDDIPLCAFPLRYPGLSLSSLSSACLEHLPTVPVEVHASLIVVLTRGGSTARLVA
eukprot:scaffold167658_cov20-Tisochrysis_lutea.AAC.1